ncbi:TonB-dependent receptor [Polymorphobacter multimanifer]|uniref:TonB-dependent receptor n=1 Tax=Polymorphobacter multimanifer TaxID=1070431 RepID=UPI00166B531B|nr:TonB-dependent receptor [Polymorphobacter multimanifer]GGI84455.1 TonB-dependent receptor [Polymorphobacter multimanifer]
MIKTTTGTRIAIRLLGCASATVIAAGSAFAQTAPPVTDGTATAAADVAGDDEIIVTSFRQSLTAALNIKRDSVAAVDVIVAEDIAKFPDQNLAESLQRIPGITIQRDAGEGRAITVRGLGAQFTRVRVNGLETVATATDGASSNRDRSFDFNVFASELFTSIVVHKTAEASLDEGSLGAVVDLNTGNPLAGKAGFNAVASVVGSYNDLSKYVGPRIAGLISWRNDEGTFGASLSAAYSRTEIDQLGNNSVRWAQPRFDSVNGTPCFTSTGTAAGAPRPNAGGIYSPSAACDEVALAFHPRIPRYGIIENDRERLRLTGSVQWAPSDSTKISIDPLYSRFREDRTEKWAEVLFRTLERPIDVSNYKSDGNNNLISGTFNDVPVRTENYFRQSQTEFYQVGGSWDQDVTDRFRFTLMGGVSRSNAAIPVETTLVYDDRDAQGYQYDYTDMQRPRLTFGTDVANPANFQLSEIRDRPSATINSFRTAQLRTEWDVTEGLTLKTGALYRRFSFDTEGFSRDTVVCGNGGVDRIFGTLACSPSSAFGPTAVYGFPGTSALSETVNLGNAGQPDGTTTTWVVPDLAAGTDFTKLYERTAAIDASNTRGVTETVKGGYAELGSKGEIFGLRYAANGGIRYVRTDQSSTGLVSGATATVKRNYDDWLPSLNIALFPTDEVIIRFAAAKVITRPALGNLTPGGTVDGFNFRITNGNPFLQPFRANSYDAAVEWYFAPESIFSVAIFKKDVSSFPVSDSRQATFASTGLPTSIIPPSSPAAVNPEGQLWTINSVINGTGANLKGIEIAVQAPFRFLPGALSNFGGIANVTFVDSSANYNVSGPVVVANTPTGAFGPLVNSIRASTLFGLSKSSFNATLYYDDGRFSARASGAYRSEFNDANSATGNIFEGYGSTFNLDASIRYKINEHVELSLEGVNLTDNYRFRFTDEDTQRNYESNHFGRTFLFGARFRL